MTKINQEWLQISPEEREDFDQWRTERAVSAAREKLAAGVKSVENEIARTNAVLKGEGCLSFQEPAPQVHRTLGALAECLQSVSSQLQAAQEALIAAVPAEVAAVCK